MSSALPPAAILTGGLARRFHGRDKSRLVVDAAGRSILERQLALLAPLASEILIVTSTARAGDFSGAAATAAWRSLSPASAVRVVLDAHPGCGPLGAILTALDTTSAPALFVVAGDMPHVSAAMLAALLQLHDRGGRDATIPESARGPEPLCAVYGRSARPALARALESGDLSLQRALERMRVGVMRADDVAAYGDPAILFRNINAPEDL